MSAEYVITGEFSDSSLDFATTATSMKEAIEIIDGVIGEDLREALENDFEDEGGWDYEGLVELRDLLESDPESVNPDALERALRNWESYVGSTKVRIFPQYKRKRANPSVCGACKDDDHDECEGGSCPCDCGWNEKD